MITELLHYLLGGQEPTPQNRRELLQGMPRDLALLGGLAYLMQSSSAEAAGLKRLGNYPVMDLEGRYHDYSKKDAPVLDVPRTEIHNYPAGILNYLTWEGNPRAGRPALLHFGAYWCDPCEANMPFLEQIYRDSRYQGLQVVSVNLMDVGIEPVEETSRKTKLKFREHGITYPTLTMDQKAMASALYGHVRRGMTVPQMLLVAMPSGEVTYNRQYLFEVGDGQNMAGDIGQLHREIEKILPSPQSPPTPAPIPSGEDPSSLVERVKALRARIERAKPQSGQ